MKRKKEGKRAAREHETMLGLEVLSAIREPHQTFSTTEIAAACNTSKESIRRSELSAWKKILDALYEKGHKDIYITARFPRYHHS